ncbi:hypothetical protein EVAR_38616_1 [Eumeta japonica]|uniref:Uncharacterized protein n=1 Tax=Eumeta variegata TaxID=151549 RepID=A0A4C1WSU9_EUMVA|nr:hypothetical protein EVAR_38616_1 [Eumeta japonica]
MYDIVRPSIPVGGNRAVPSAQRQKLVLKRFPLVYYEPDGLKELILCKITQKYPILTDHGSTRPHIAVLHASIGIVPFGLFARIFVPVAHDGVPLNRCGNRPAKILLRASSMSDERRGDSYDRSREEGRVGKRNRSVRSTSFEANSGRPSFLACTVFVYRLPIVQMLWSVVKKAHDLASEHRILCHCHMKDSVDCG